MNKKFLFIILILTTLSWHLSLQNNDTIDAETKNTAQISTSEKTSLAPALVALSHFPLQDPSNNMPLLEWREDLNAVYYELELFDTIPDDLRLSIDRDSKYFKSNYSLRTECERYNSRFKNTGQERMWVRNKASVTNLNTLAHISLLAVAVAAITSHSGQSYRKLKTIKRIA
jgi:hypothetical protein